MLIFEHYQKISKKYKKIYKNNNRLLLNIFNHFSLKFSYNVYFKMFNLLTNKIILSLNII